MRGRPIVPAVLVAVLLATAAVAPALPSRGTGRSSPGLGRALRPDRSQLAPAYGPFLEMPGLGFDVLTSRPVPRPAPSPWRALLGRPRSDLPIRARPGAGPVVGVLPAASPYLGTPTVAWVMDVTPDGRYGLVPVPYAPTPRVGWIPLRSVRTAFTSVLVRVSLSRHQLVVERAGKVVLRTPVATGAPATPTPTGRYFVTDEVVTPRGGPFGGFAFGLSGIQPRLPRWWGGGDQLAIHGTDDPASIGRSASHGCIRVPAWALRRLRALLSLGTPVVIRP